MSHKQQMNMEQYGTTNMEQPERTTIHTIAGENPKTPKQVTDGAATDLMGAVLCTATSLSLDQCRLVAFTCGGEKLRTPLYIKGAFHFSFSLVFLVFSYKRVKI